MLSLNEILDWSCWTTRNTGSRMKRRGMKTLWADTNEDDHLVAIRHQYILPWHLYNLGLSRMWKWWIHWTVSSTSNWQAGRHLTVKRWKLTINISGRENRRMQCFSKRLNLFVTHDHSRASTVQIGEEHLCRAHSKHPEPEQLIRSHVSTSRRTLRHE